MSIAKRKKHQLFNAYGYGYGYVQQSESILVGLYLAGKRVSCITARELMIMDKPSKPKGLNRKQEQFVHEYCIDQNATQAARRAGYSHKCASAIGARMLRNVKIKNKIDTILRKHCDALGVTTQQIVEEDKCIAFADIRQIVDAADVPIPLSKLPEEIASAISSLKITAMYDHDGEQIGNVYEYKFNDKGRSLERLGKHKGMYIDRVQVEFVEFQNLIMDVIGECDPSARAKIVERLAETTEMAERG